MVERSRVGLLILVLVNVGYSIQGVKEDLNPAKCRPQVHMLLLSIPPGNVRLLPNFPLQGLLTLDQPYPSPFSHEGGLPFCPQVRSPLSDVISYGHAPNSDIHCPMQSCMHACTRRSYVFPVTSGLTYTQIVRFLCSSHALVVIALM